MNPEQHEAHMQKVKEGLTQILESQDIDQIHSIAQSLLAEEESEMTSEQGDGNVKGNEAINKFFMERQR